MVASGYQFAWTEDDSLITAITGRYYYFCNDQMYNIMCVYVSMYAYVFVSFTCKYI